MPANLAGHGKQTSTEAFRVHSKDGPHRIPELAQRVEQALPFDKRSLAEDYVEGALGLHLYFRVRTCLPKFEPGEYRVVLKRKNWKFLPVNDLKVARKWREFTVVRDDNGYGNHPMLVHIIEFLEKPKRMRLRVCGVAAHRVERLVTHDKPLISFEQTLDLYKTTTGCGTSVSLGAEKVDGVPKNRELGLTRGWIALEASELVNEVVKRGAEVMNEVTDQHSPIREARTLIQACPNDALSLFQVEISHDMVSALLQKPFHGLAEFRKMDLCSL